MRKFWLGLLITILLSLILVPTALAVDLRSDSRLVITQSEIIDEDLVFGGNSLIVNGTVHGDVFAFAQSVEVYGTIDGNLVAFGSRVDVKGTVKGTVISAANDLLVGGQIDGSLVTAGATLTVDQAATIGRSWLAAGDRLRMEGNIGRGVLAAANTLEVGGQVGRDLQAYAGDLTIGSSARVGGPVTYTSNRQAAIDPAAHTGRVTYHQSESKARYTPPFWYAGWSVLGRVVRFAGFVLFGLVLLSLFPRLRTAFPQVVWEKPWQAPVAGFLALLAVPVGAVLLMVTVVGLPLGITSLLVFPVAVYGSQILVSWSVATLVADRAEPLHGLNWAVLFLLGALVTTLLVALPVVGPIIRFLGLLYGLGGLYFAVLQQRPQA